jgi:hypothetical protein
VSRKYIDLLTSLPYLANPFVHRRPPISEIQLQVRLNMLEPDDREMVRRLARAFYWGRLEMEDTDAEVIRAGRRLLDETTQPDLREWLLWRMDFRTLVAALRRRHDRPDAPPADSDWGFGNYVLQIERNWNHPSFHLEGRFPWLTEARNLLEAGDSYGLERLLLTVCWNYYTRQVPDDPWGLPAIWLYLNRWDLVERWCSYDADQAKTRFDEIVAVSLEQPLEELRKIA